jgi:hypothetical protein
MAALTTLTVLVSPVMVTAEASPAICRDLPVSRVLAVPAAARAVVLAMTLLGMTWYCSTAFSSGRLASSWLREVPSADSSCRKAASVGTRMVPAFGGGGLSGKAAGGIGSARAGPSRAGPSWHWQQLGAGGSCTASASSSSHPRLTPEGGRGHCGGHAGGLEDG